MLDGWYCRSMANMQADGQESHQNDDDYSSDSSQSEQEQVNYKLQYNNLKKKLKCLIYENECFQDILRSSQKRLLKASRDRSFLLDRLLQYEKPENTSSDSDDTDSSDDADMVKVEPAKKRRIDVQAMGQAPPSRIVTNKPQNTVKRKRQPATKKVQQNHTRIIHTMNSSSRSAASLAGVGGSLINSTSGDGHMTPEEVERHLQSRQNYLELLPERAPPTVPTEMFSNDPSLDSESNDILENSPCNIDDWVE